MSDKILVLKQSGVTQFQAVGEGKTPRLRDMFSTAMGRGADTSKRARFGAGLGALARLGAIGSVAQQTGSSMQRGNTVRPVYQSGYDLQATDTTGQMQDAGIIPSNQAMAPPIQPTPRVPLPEQETVPLPTPSPPMANQQTTGGQVGTPMPSSVANQLPAAQPTQATTQAQAPPGTGFNMGALQPQQTTQPQQPQQPIPVSSTPPQPQQPLDPAQQTLPTGRNPALGPQNLAPAPSPPMQALKPPPAGPPPASASQPVPTPQPQYLPSLYHTSGKLSDVGRVNQQGDYYFPYPTKETRLNPEAIAQVPSEYIDPFSTSLRTGFKDGEPFMPRLSSVNRYTGDFTIGHPRASEVFGQQRKDPMDAAIERLQQNRARYTTPPSPAGSININGKEITPDADGNVNYNQGGVNLNMENVTMGPISNDAKAAGQRAFQQVIDRGGSMAAANQAMMRAMKNFLELGEIGKANIFALNAMHMLGDEIFLKSPEKVGFACAHLYLKSR